MLWLVAPGNTAFDSWIASACVFCWFVAIAAWPFFRWVRRHGPVSPLNAVGIAIVIGILADTGRAVVLGGPSGLVAHGRDLWTHPVALGALLPFCIVAVPLVLLTNRHIVPVDSVTEDASHASPQ